MGDEDDDPNRGRVRSRAIRERMDRTGESYLRAARAVDAAWLAGRDRAAADSSDRTEVSGPDGTGRTEVSGQDGGAAT